MNCLAYFAKIILIALVYTTSLASQAEPTQSTATQTSPQLVPLYNYLGFRLIGPKWLVVPGERVVSFKVIAPNNDQPVLQGETTRAAYWPEAAQWVSLADVSALTAPGEYQFLVPGLKPIHFTIAAAPYSAVHDSAIKAFYYNRASIALEPRFAGPWARAAGHPDTSVKVHSSAASDARPAGFTFSAPKGWYDAGDYNKYVVNSGISTYTLLRAYADFADFYQQRQWQIPESDNATPDLLDEIMWNLDWLSAMQDPNDGGVYHKLTTLSFAGIVMPDQTHAERFVVQKSTAAALNFAAVMANASRVIQPFESQWPGKAALYRQQALAAWQWAQQYPAVYYQQPADVHTGAYGDEQLADEWAWAGVELFLLTSEPTYLTAFRQLTGLSTASSPSTSPSTSSLPSPSLSPTVVSSRPTTPSWANVAALAYYSLAAELRQGRNLDSVIVGQVTQGLLQAADQLVSIHQQSAYGVAMRADDFVWGSNAVAMNKAMLLYQAWLVSPQPRYEQAMQGLLDYVLGRNPLQLSYVTGFGITHPQFIHHRPSAADNVDAPVPGWLVGGPQPGQQDQCAYTTPLPALSYVDDWCSYASNEVAINWNAPLVYVLAAMHHLPMTTSKDVEPETASK